MAIYGYARESTDKQELGLEAQIEMLEANKCKRIFIDKGVSGKDNINEGKGWSDLMDVLQPDDQIIVTSQSRLGRKSYEVTYAVGKLIERGASIRVLEENRVYDDLDNFEQNLNLTFRSITDHTERTEISRRTKKSLDFKVSAGARLGRKPKLTQADIDRIHKLREAGLGYQTIANAILKEDRSGRMKPVSVNTVKEGLRADYMSREAWEAHNAAVNVRLGLQAAAVREAEAR